MTDTPTPHRATEDEWRNIEYMRQPIKIAPGFMAGGKEQGIASCIVELREALAALEQRVGALELHATTRTIRVSAEAFEAVTDLINGDSELHWGEAPAADPATDVDVFRALAKAEAALADIGDAEREPGDDLAWCERRAAEALPFVREALAFCSPPAAAAAPSPPAGSLVEVVKPATDKELRALMEDFAGGFELHLLKKSSDCIPIENWVAAARVIYNRGREDAAVVGPPSPPPSPAGSLVDVVAQAMLSIPNDDTDTWQPEARAAIAAVAGVLRTHRKPAWTGVAADWLEREAGR
jgi:hypothetical protein